MLQHTTRYGPGGAPGTMGLTFGTPNDTAASYAPVVSWATSVAALLTAGGTTGGQQQQQQPGGGKATAVCTSSAPRSCYTASPVMHYCNMTGLAPR